MTGERRAFLILKGVFVGGILGCGLMSPLSMLVDAILQFVGLAPTIHHWIHRHTPQTQDGPEAMSIWIMLIFGWVCILIGGSLVAAYYVRLESKREHKNL